ncbi:hypothetical protein GYMLUDRAFT_242331 [Collybiopsis luxurians FD-317 M1]|uniref:Uncharacterized protein n=1 Tax=Collybiopsis luxurians FD-317 M1 TaxID=944289 RepID=A0A0D0C3I5_9AGAR|nr:hypothetical protein GYMLUDRAFT_242331 [Collybiopsis luxurians FD-317 M1]
MWAARKWVIIGPAVISVINAGLGIASVTFEGISHRNIKSELALTPASITWDMKRFSHDNFNPLAGRLWWISRATRQYLGHDLSSGKRMKNVVAMVIESGLLYPLALIPSIIVQTLRITAVGKVFPLQEPLLTVIVAIAPTMIMVMIDLGVSIQANPGTISVHVPERWQPMVHTPSQDLEISRPLRLSPLQVDQDHEGDMVLTSSALNHLPQKYRVADSEVY